MIDLRLGDCLDVMRGIPDASIDAVITDPPYGMNKGFANDSPLDADRIVTGAMAEIRRICKGNVIAFWSAQRLSAIDDLFHPKRVMIWNKTWSIYTPNNVGYRYEPIVWVSGNTANRMRGDIFECFPIIRKCQSESVGHPTQKPEQLMCEIVGDFTKEGMTILDPFMGSGTTGVACVKLNRNFIGIEINPQYYAIAERRIQEAQAQMAMQMVTA